MTVTREGGCQCGAVRYRLTGDPIMLAVCHCTECQRQTGSAFGMSLWVRVGDFRLLTGRLKTFERSSESGLKVKCAFCPECGTRIHHEPERMQGQGLNVRAGTLDDTSGLTPTAHVWTDSKQPWVPIPENTTVFPRQPGA
jgi:hypothetical protein